MSIESQLPPGSTINFKLHTCYLSSQCSTGFVQVTFDPCHDYLGHLDALIRLISELFVELRVMYLHHAFHCSVDLSENGKDCSCTCTMAPCETHRTSITSDAFPNKIACLSMIAHRQGKNDADPTVHQATQYLQLRGWSKSKGLRMEK